MATRYHWFILITVLAVSGWAASSGLAQEPGTGAQKDGDAMRGPKVGERQSVPTLVRRDASGKLERLEVRPEQGAVDLLKLTPEERKPVDGVFVARLLEINKALQEHYDLFIKLQTARQGGAKPEEVRPLMREFRPAIVGLIEPALVERVEAVISEGKRAEYRGYVDEYKRAFAASEPMGERGGGAGAGTGGGGGRGRGVEGREKGEKDGGEMKPADGAASTGPIPARVELNLLLREMGRSLKGIVDERKEHMDHFLKSIEATPEQEAKIRAITREAAEANKKNGGNGGIGEPTQEEKLATFRKILDVLTPEQRKKAIEARRG